MKRLLATLAVVATLFAIALPAQASSVQRHYLGTTASAGERASFGCGAPGHVNAYLLHHAGRYIIAPRGTVKHANRIVAACTHATPGHILKARPYVPLCITPTGATHCKASMGTIVKARPSQYNY